jgi:hypothetical protein
MYDVKVFTHSGGDVSLYGVQDSGKGFATRHNESPLRKRFDIDIQGLLRRLEKSCYVLTRFVLLVHGCLSILQQLRDHPLIARVDGRSERLLRT